MSTIVVYQDERPAMNRYPERITSPSRPRNCCASHMAFIGETCRDGRISFQYKRCEQCGFTVRVMFERMADRGLLLDLQQTFARIFRRDLLTERPRRKARRPRASRREGAACHV